MSGGPPVGGQGTRTTRGGRVLIVTKAPVPGRTKTRLVPPLDAAEAARLVEAMLFDTIETSRREVDDVRLLVADPGDVDLVAALCPGIAVERQQGQGLADALCLGLARSTADAGPTAIISSDIPGTPPGQLRRAFDLLEEGADLVFGPAMDGGYWLVAARTGHTQPFRDIPWSTPATLSVTLERCRAAGLRVELVQAWRDVDTAADLAALQDGDALAGAARTRAALQAVAAGAVWPGDVPAVAASRLILQTPWRTHLIDRLAFADGRETDYSYVATPRAAFVVPVTASRDVVLVRQYRHPVRDYTLEVPGGGVGEGEQPIDAARRELLEEVGATAAGLVHLATFYSSSAHLTLRSDAYLAADVVLGPPRPELGEDVVRVLMPFADAVGAARSGRIAEGQTALALLLAAAHLGVTGPPQ